MLAEAPFTQGEGPGVTRYAYTEAYSRTVQHFAGELEALGYSTWYDPRARGQSVTYQERQRIEPTRLDGDIVAALGRAAERTGAATLRMHSAAAHDTMMVARRVPAAMGFVPCEGGISHAPEERAEPADGALAAEVILAAIQELMGR